MCDEWTFIEQTLSAVLYVPAKNDVAAAVR